LLLLGRAVEKGVVCGDALAAVAVSTGAMAQSNVSISGVLEIAPLANAKVTTQAANQDASTSTKTSATGQGNTWSTSVLNISGTEDLGGGLKASFVLISGSGQGAGDSGIGNRERTLALAGDFGTVRFGRFVPAAAAGFHALSGTGSATLLGSMYGLSTGNEAMLGATRANFERQDNVIQYTSPNFNGFTANLAYVNASSDRSAAANAGKNRIRQTGVHLGYAAGPLSVGFGMNDRKAEQEAGDIELCANNATGAISIALECPGTSTLIVDLGAVGQATVKSDLDWIGASYNLGVATVFASHVKRKDTTSVPGAATVTNADAKATSFGVSVPVDAFTLRASMYRGKDKRGTGNTDDMKLSGHQVSVSYALSKRTSVIAATGTNQVKRDGAAARATATRKATASTLTVNHSF
jgi:predicted porin